MIEVRHLRKVFHEGGKDICAANDLCFRIEDGEFVSIVGRSGSGKSTLMHLIGGLDRGDEGEIVVNGRVLSGLTSDQLAEYRSKETGFVFQAFHLEPQYSVLDNIRVALLIAGVPFREHGKRIEAALESVDLADKLHVRAAKLSGGEKQRVAIARALINNPGIILADEPCGNLDSENSDRIIGLLENLHRLGKTVIFVTHNGVDARRAERVIELSDGKMVRDEKIRDSVAQL